MVSYSALVMLVVVLCAVAAKPSLNAAMDAHHGRRGSGKHHRGSGECHPESRENHPGSGRHNQESKESSEDCDPETEIQPPSETEEADQCSQPFTTLMVPENASLRIASKSTQNTCGWILEGEVTESKLVVICDEVHLRRGNSLQFGPGSDPAVFTESRDNPFYWVFESNTGVLAFVPRFDARRRRGKSDDRFSCLAFLVDSAASTASTESTPSTASTESTPSTASTESTPETTEYVAVDTTTAVETSTPTPGSTTSLSTPSTASTESTIETTEYVTADTTTAVVTSAPTPGSTTTLSTPSTASTESTTETTAYVTVDTTTAVVTSAPTPGSTTTLST